MIFLSSKIVYRAVLALFLVVSMSACDKIADTTSGGGGDSAKGTEASADTEAEQTAASEPEPESSSSIDPEPTRDIAKEPQNSRQELMECVAGHYNFVTDKDGKKHFSAEFYADGNILYWLQDGPKGTWNMDRGDDTISYRGPFGINHDPHTFHWKIQDRGSDCKIQSFVGKTFGGNDMTASRR